jgi:AcrR family transcriptional regulator
MTDTRTSLLDAGVRLYGSNAAELLRGLSAGSVADEAGFHRQTFYRYWETQAEYVQDLMRHVLVAARAPVADGVTDLPTRRGVPGDLEDLARDLAHHDFVQVFEDPAVMLRVGLVVMQALDQSALGDQAQAYYDTTIDRVATGYQGLLDGIGRQPVDEVSARDLARIVQALLLGLVLQAKTADDDPHASTLLERATTAILAGLTQPIEADETATG